MSDLRPGEAVNDGSTPTRGDVPASIPEISDPYGTRRRPPYRRLKARLFAVLFITTAVAVALFLLANIPLVSTSFDQTLTASNSNYRCYLHPFSVAFQLGDARYAALSGTWTTTGTFESGKVTISSPGQGCGSCSGLLYSSTLGSAGFVASFHVSGNGPFTVALIPVAGGSVTAVFQGTLVTSIL